MSIDGSVLSATVNGLAVYLDHWAISDLAEGDSSRRKRFVHAVRTGGDLLFSEANAAELAGPQGKSVDAIRTFLDELGPHWFPMELNPFDVAEREQEGMGVYECCVAKGFMSTYFRDRTKDSSPGSGKLIDLSDDFFRLGAVMDWVVPNRGSIREMSAKFDKTVCDAVRTVRLAYGQNPSPGPPFDSTKRATFTSGNLVRILIAEWGQLTPHDGLDFCHAAMGSAFARFAALDHNWKRRVEKLSTPNGLARIYYKPELDQMVTDIELALKQGGTPR